MSKRKKHQKRNGVGLSLGDPGLQSSDPKSLFVHKEPTVLGTI